MRRVHSRRSSGCWAVAASLALCSLPPAAHAVSFHSDSGDWTGSWDTTIGYGQGWRVSGLDCRLVAIANGGCGYSPNIDDGDLNYQARAAYTEVFTGITEFALNYKEKYGIFVRGSGLYDFEVMDGNTDWMQLSHAAKDYVGSYTRLLDAFGYWRFDLGSHASELRAGRQVVDWGESTFIPGGLNSVNYFDTTALVVPGSELKQALLPDEMVVFNTDLTKNLSTQLLYLFDWHEDILEPDGAYFSANNFAGPGGKQVVLGFGTISSMGVDFSSLGGGVISPFQAIPRLPDQTPPNAGQYGMKFKLYLPNFGQGTELGLYFLNYTSRVPVVSAVTGTQAGLANGFGAINAVAGAAQALAAGLPFAAAVATGAAVGQQRAAALGGNLGAATAAQYATIGANTLLAGGNVNNQAQNLATNEFAKTEGLVEQFPQDIKMLGLSFNTQIQKTGTALQGELVYRHDVPVQIDDVELIYASLTPFESGIARLLGEPVSKPGDCNPKSPTPITGCNQLGSFGLSQTVQGWTLEDAWQAGFTATQVFANVFKASQAVLLFEAAADYYPNLQSRTSGGPVGLGLRYDGPGTNLSGNPNLGGYPQFPAVNGQCVVPGYQCVEPGWAFADKLSWGYVVAGHLEYDNVIAEWNLTPHVFWSQDVTGISPGPGGNFVAGRHAVTAGLGASLHSRWELDLSYTQYGGAGQYNLLNDRDFIAASIKVSF
jgi:uncharacterized protein DUF1302